MRVRCSDLIALLFLRAKQKPYQTFVFLALGLKFNFRSLNRISARVTLTTASKISISHPPINSIKSPTNYKNYSPCKLSTSAPTKCHIILHYVQLLFSIYRHTMHLRHTISLTVPTFYNPMYISLLWVISLEAYLIHAIMHQFYA